MALSLRRGKTEDKLGKEWWQIVAADSGEVLKETGYGESAAIARAQSIALDGHPDLVVRYKTVFGDPDPLYRITKQQDGAVTTTPL